MGIGQDREQARRHYLTAAKMGQTSAQLALGDLLVEIGDDSSVLEAVRWYEQAAAAGAPGAFFGLAELHESGRGVPIDRAKAIFFHRKAAEAGHEGALRALAHLTEPQPAA
jgi:TPR repeat protein